MSARRLPVRPDFDQLKNQAKDLLKAYRGGDAEASAHFAELRYGTTLSSRAVSSSRSAPGLRRHGDRLTRGRKGSRDGVARRLITLIFAGRDRIIVIRRELPRTNRRGFEPEGPPHRSHRGFSFPCAPRLPLPPRVRPVAIVASRVYAVAARSRLDRARRSPK